MRIFIDDYTDSPFPTYRSFSMGPCKHGRAQEQREQDKTQHGQRGQPCLRRSLLYARTRMQCFSRACVQQFLKRAPGKRRGRFTVTCMRRTQIIASHVQRRTTLTRTRVNPFCTRCISLQKCHAHVHRTDKRPGLHTYRSQETQSSKMVNR